VTADIECLQVLSTAQADIWKTHLPARRSAFGSVEYASIVERHREEVARLILFRSQEDHALVTYPLFLRAASELSFETSVAHEAWDAASPEYTGPLATGPNTEAGGRAFRQIFDRYCQHNRIITEFAHLHPWRTAPGVHWLENVRPDREIVYVDLEQSNTDLWQQSLTYACRKNINRARRENVKVFSAEKPDDICQFHQVYSHTMDRNRAQARYYYPLQFFMDFFEQMPDHARFALAEHDGKIVAGTLFLHDDHDVYAYLGGAYHADQGVRPTNAVVYETICWAQEQGKKRLILGGGYKDNDGIFRFKASFSPLRAGFSVYRQIHLPDQYDALCREWASHYGASPEHGSYFPPYRSRPENMR
jgi:serine/alanine adding enzyme